MPGYRTGQQGPYVSLSVSNVGIQYVGGTGAFLVSATVVSPAGAGAVAFACRSTLRNAGAAPGADSRLLPQFPQTSYVNLLPGEAWDVEIGVDAGTLPPQGGHVTLEVDGWNVLPVTAVVY